METDITSLLSQDGGIPDFSVLFSSSHSKRVQIMAAVARLGITLNQPVEAKQLISWADRLQIYSPEHLKQAFIHAESRLKAWPTPAVIADLILDWEYEADREWLLANLKIHGIEWKDREQRRGNSRPNPNPVYDPTKTAEEVLWIPGEIIPAIPAPAISPVLTAALKTFGDNGTVMQGLSRMAAHPVLHSDMYEKESERQRGRERLENGFKVAWIKARLALG